MYWRDGLKDDAVDCREKLDAVAAEFGDHFVAHLYARLDEAVGILQGKMDAREIKECLRECKGKVNKVVKQTKERNPAWWKQGLEDETPDALDALAAGDDRFAQSSPEWVNGAAELRGMLEDAVSKLRSLQSERALDDDKREAKNKVKGVSQQIKQTNPAWWKQGIEDSGSVTDFLDELLDKHAGNDTWMSIESELRSELDAAVKALKSKLAGREIEDDKRDAKNKVRNVANQIKQTNPAWWKQGIEDSTAVIDFLAELADKYDGIDLWPPIEQELRGELDAAVKELKSKLAGREIEDDKRDAKNKVRNVANQIKQTNPAWWKQGIEDSTAVIDFLAELADKYDGIDLWPPIEQELRGELGTAVQELKSKLAGREIEDDKRDARTKLNSVTSQLKQVDPAWWREGIEKSSDVVDFLAELADKYSGIDLWPPIEQEIRGELDSAVKELKSKLAGREIEDDKRDARTKLNSVTSQLKQVDPAWWREGIEKSSDVVDFLAELADKYSGIDLWPPIEQEIRGELDSAVKELKSKLAGREIEDDKRDARTKLNSVTSQLKQVDPAWWREGIEKSSDVVDFLAELADKYSGIDLWPPIEQEIRGELDSAVKELKSKLAGREIEDDKRDATNLLRAVTRHLSQRDPAWWKEALDNVPACEDKLTELADKYSGIDLWPPIEIEIRNELNAAVKELKSKQSARWLEDDERELSSALSKVTAQLKQRDPAWWKEGLETHAPVVRDKLEELAEKHGRADVWLEVDARVRSELQNAVAELKSKQAARWMQDDEREAKSALSKVTGQLSQKDPAWWKEGLEQAQVCSDKLDELAEKYAGAEAWVSFEDQIRNDLDAAVKELKSKQAARWMQDDEREAKSALSKVTGQLSQKDPAWWKEGLEQAQVCSDKLDELAEKYAGAEAWVSFEDQIRNDLDAAVKELKSKQAARWMQDDEREAKSALSKVTGQLSQKDPAWWKEGLEQAQVCSDKLDELAEKYAGAEAWVSFEDQIRNDLDAAVKELKSKQAARWMQDDEREAKSALSKVTGQLSQKDPAWWKEGLEQAQVCSDKLDELAEKYAGAEAWVSFEDQIRNDLDAAVKELKSKQAARWMQDDEREAKSALSKVTGQLSQKDPAWWKEGLEQAQVCSDKLDELAEKYAGAEAWVSFEDQIRNDLDAAVKELTSKQAARWMQDDEREAKSALSKVTGQLSQKDPAWWKEGLEQAQVCSDKLDELAEKYAGAEAWVSFEDQIRNDLDAAVKELKSKQAARWMQDDEREAKSALSKVTGQLSQKDPAWWKEGLEQAQACSDKLDELAEKYAGAEAWVSFEDQIRNDLDAAVKQLKTKIAGRTLQDDEREAKSALSKVTGQLSQKDPAWWQQGLENAGGVADMFDAFADKFVPIPCSLFSKSCWHAG